MKYFFVERLPWQYIMVVENDAYTICKRRNIEGTHGCSKNWSEPSRFLTGSTVFPNFHTVTELKEAQNPFFFIKELSKEEAFVEVL